jgi:hypothetical protein
MSASPINIFQFEQEVTVQLLETNISTTNADAQTLQTTASANELLTQGWLSDPENAPNPAYNPSNPPNTTSNCPYLNPVYNALYVDVLQNMNSGAASGSLFSNFTTFMNTYMTGAYQDNISDALMIQVIQTLSNPSVWPAAGDTTNGPIASGYLTQLNAFKSNIDALANEEEQTGKTDSNMEESVISLDGNAPSSFTAVFSSIMEGMDVTSNILQQGV